MNSLIIFPDEIQLNIATISGRHLSYVHEAHKLEIGGKLPVSIWGGGRGHGTIKQLDGSILQIEFTIDQGPISREPIVLIIAAPRPQTQKKIIHLATVLGVSEVHFVRSERSQKSYLLSNVLEEESLKYEVIKGLEQAYDSIPPIIQVHHRFKPYLEDVLTSAVKSHPSNIGILCDTTQSKDQTIHDASKITPKSGKVFVAIGPEAGWNEYELECFKKLGFYSVSLGARILRCETACAVILGQLKLVMHQLQR